MVYIVHIGKCGGGTIFIECKRRKIKFQRAHLKKPKINKESQYIILIRDPINRLISAFNWKMFRCLTKEGQLLRGKKKPYQNYHESEAFKYWKNVNNFAENIFDNNGDLEQMASKLIKHSNHLKADIFFYLEDLLTICDSKNCQVIRYEYYHEDIRQVLGIQTVKTHNHKNNNQYSKFISQKGKENLRQFLKKDYDCFEILKSKNIIDDQYYQDIISGNFN